MKRIISAFLSLMMICTLCACSQSSDDQVSKEVTSQETSDANATTSTATHAGTRSDPYSFADEITITTKGRIYNDYIVEYTINLNELWGSNKVSTEYSDYIIGDEILVRGQISVNCDSTDDMIYFDLNATYITSSLNEKNASIQTYKKGELDNVLETVYSGGSYDIIILSQDDGIGSLDIPYLKIGYTDVDGNPANVWVQMPENTDEETSLHSEMPDEPEETDANTPTQASGRDPSSATTPELKNELTPEELDSLLLEQPMYVESTEYVVQDEYKGLYSDELQTVVKNNSGTDVKNVVVAFVAWDKNNFPVKVYNRTGVFGSYVARCKYDDVNMLNGTSYRSGIEIGDKTEIATFKAIVASYEDFDGKTWDNPYYDTWVNLYSNKKLG